MTDRLAALLALLLAPVLQLIARRRHRKPRLQAQLDRLGVALRTTHY